MKAIASAVFRIGDQWRCKKDGSIVTIAAIEQDFSRMRSGILNIDDVVRIVLRGTAGRISRHSPETFSRHYDILGQAEPPAER